MPEITPDPELVDRILKGLVARYFEQEGYLPDDDVFEAIATNAEGLSEAQTEALFLEVDARREDAIRAALDEDRREQADAEYAAWLEGRS